MFPDVARTKSRDQGQTPLLVLGVQRFHQLLQVVAGHCRAALQPNRVLDATREFDMRTVGLARTVTDPDHMTRSRQPLAGLAVLTTKRLFIFQQERFMAGIILNRLQGMCGFRRHPSRCHEIKRVGNPIGDLAVLLGLFVVGKAQGPAVYLMHIRVTTGRKRTDQVQRRGGLSVSAQHFFRVRDAGLGRERQLVDDVAAVAGKLHAVYNFCRGRTRLGKLARHPPQLDHRHLGTVGQHDRHLQHHFESVADHVAAELLKTFGAIAPLKQERLTSAGCGKMLFQTARFACKNQQWIPGQFSLDGAQRVLIRIVGHLDPRFVAPA